jgi:hypothetical protein
MSRGRVTCSVGAVLSVVAVLGASAGTVALDLVAVSDGCPTRKVLMTAGPFALEH